MLVLESSMGHTNTNTNTDTNTNTEPKTNTNTDSKTLTRTRKPKITLTLTLTLTLILTITLTQQCLCRYQGVSVYAVPRLSARFFKSLYSEMNLTNTQPHTLTWMNVTNTQTHVTETKTENRMVLDAEVRVRL